MSVSDLTEFVADTIRRQRLFVPGQRILVAVSGGLDSLVLLCLLHDLSKKTGWQLTVAHLNHQLRGSSSRADERLVRRTAERLGLPVIIERRDVRALQRRRKLSLEMAARKTRHDFLARTAARVEARVIALAHHADDQLELFFLRLLRGSGGQGLGGMPWRNPSPSDRQVDLARPLLQVSKATLRQYARERKLYHREDASNADPGILRNRIRHRLLPLLRKDYQPALEEVIGRTMDIIRAESEFAGLAATDWLGRVRRRNGMRGYVRSEQVDADGSRPFSFGGYVRSEQVDADGSRPFSFGQLHVSVQRRCLQAQLIALGIVPDYELVEKLRNACGSPVSVGQLPEIDGPDRGQPVDTPAPATGLVVRDAAGVLHLQERVPRLGGFDRSALTCELKAGRGTACFHGVRLRWLARKDGFPAKFKHLAHNELFDADRVGTPIILRHWQPGDRFQPIGMASATKLQDLFTNQRVPRAVRRQLTVATTAEGEIFWVEGLRIAERFKLTTKTIRRLHWAWQRL